MKRYDDWAPTAMDPKGLLLDDNKDWFVALSRNRDSGVMDESNWAEALKILGGESDTVMIAQFGHWACGWFEIILVKPDSDSFKKAEEIEATLENYPLLDNDGYYQLVHDRVEEYIKSDLRHVIFLAVEKGHSIFSARSNKFHQIPADVEEVIESYVEESN